jgi:cell division initiation protein
MAITSLEIREYPLSSSISGYNKKDVEALRDLASEAITDATRRITELEATLRDATDKLVEHEKREAMLKDTITTAQKMVDDLKGNAVKEAELIIVEARHNADAITKLAQKRVIDVQGEVRDLKKQRIELEVKLKALLEYHLSVLTMETKNARERDEASDKIKFLQNK